MMIPRIASLALATPPFEIRQQDVAAAAAAVFADRPEVFERLRPIYANAGIQTRYSCVPLEWYTQPHGWRERHEIYVESSLELLERAANRCLAESGIPAEMVDGIVTVSTTGIAAPSLEARLMQRIGFRPDLQRLPVFGLGCAGGVLGLSRTAALARANPEQYWLFLVVELCGLTFRAGDKSNANIVATALFGDGAAATLISCRAQGPAIADWGEHTWPDSLDVMGWEISDDGFGVIFSRDIPSLVRRQFREAAQRFLTDSNLSLDDISAFAMHPGGAKVIGALEEALGPLVPGLETSRSVLRRFGNMSAATVMFVLRELLARGSAGRMMLGALGPGFTAAFALLELD